MYKQTFWLNPCTNMKYETEKKHQMEEAGMQLGRRACATSGTTFGDKILVTSGWHPCKHSCNDLPRISLVTGIASARRAILQRRAPVAWGRWALQAHVLACFTKVEAPLAWAVCAVPPSRTRASGPSSARQRKPSTSNQLEQQLSQNSSECCYLRGAVNC